MSMSRRDYIKIAKVVKNVQSNFINDESYFDFIHSLCVIFEDDNDRFDSDRFKKATGVIAWKTLKVL